ncbi:MAG: hypothetical protein GY809_04555 [Planctomycetes bacterium]|nr:hypothetical protein [Planctomycetota bacterium]
MISMSWDTADSELTPARIVDRLHGDTWPQTGCDMFAMSTGATPQHEPRKLWIGMRIGKDLVD